MTQIGNAIVQHARQWAGRSCKETRVNGGSCIDDLQIAYGGTTSREAYCAKFVWVVVDQACKEIGIVSTLPKTAGARDMRDRSKGRLPMDQNFTVGSCFYRYSTAPSASGHMGIVVDVTPDALITVEGNNGNRIGVFENKLSAVRDTRNGWVAIHTDMIPGGQMPYGVQFAKAGNDALILLALLGGGIFVAKKKRLI